MLVDSSGNFYLQVASELGLVGLLFFLLDILKQIYKSNFKRKRESKFDYLNAGISTGIVAMFVIFFWCAYAKF